MGHSESCCKSLLVSVPISYNRRDLLIAPRSTHESSRKERRNNSSKSRRQEIYKYRTEIIKQKQQT